MMEEPADIPKRVDPNPIPISDTAAAIDGSSTVREERGAETGRGDRRYTMDLAQSPQRGDPTPSMACVDAKKRPCSVTPANLISKDDDNTSSSLAPLDDEDLLQEILLRLPPRPSALPRASLVCKRWRSILSNTQFLSRYRKHHRKPPLLGFFEGATSTHHDFVPVLDMKPDCIPTARFSVPKSSKSYHHWDFLGCRHGLAILLINWRREVVVWDPLTGQQHRMSFPPGLHETEGEKFWVWHAAVLCADAEDGHVHGDCFSSPFKLVLVCSGRTQASACLYESLSGVWGNIVLTMTTEAILQFRPSILIGNALFWLLSGGGVLAFDINRESLGEIEKPVDAHHTDCFSIQLLRTDDSGLGFAVLSKLSIHIWEKKLNSDAIQWVPLQKIIHLEGLFPRGMRSDLKEVEMVGYEEDSNMIVLSTYIGDFMLQLESMRFERFSKRNCTWNRIHHPYRNFYTAGKGVGWKWVDQKL
ncbi:unnamed protein product [Triticum turgidum subsp. durum]|uniref:F-box domain-containing protein n=1 Tax=Triticum turgidum subsp. durum TaxID=4567 RepID=A0A9R0XQY6_TRITD|nr:unnamed protein product [Triticum turgidum subsp. durum]